MNCDEAAPLLAADADGEIDRLRGHAIGRHLESCPACAAKHAALLDLRGQLRGGLHYFQAPPALRARARAAGSAAAPAATLPAGSKRWHWFGGGALAGALAVALLWGVGTMQIGSRAWEDAAAEAVAVHTRATLGNRLVEVASSDRHQVKPWLSARLDYAIPVQDWAEVGFALQGARIEHLGRQPVATLVYRHREHVIDVFVRPQTAAGFAPALRTVRGFHVASTSGADMEWLATSDLSADVLAAFVQGLAKGSVAPAAE